MLKTKLQFSHAKRFSHAKHVLPIYTMKPLQIKPKPHRPYTHGKNIDSQLQNVLFWFANLLRTLQVQFYPFAPANIWEMQHTVSKVRRSHFPKHSCTSGFHNPKVSTNILPRAKSKCLTRVLPQCVLCLHANLNLTFQQWRSRITKYALCQPSGILHTWFPFACPSSFSPDHNLSWSSFFFILFLGLKPLLEPLGHHSSTDDGT